MPRPRTLRPLPHPAQIRRASNALRSIIYENRDHPGGLATQAIAELWLELSNRFEEPVPILSTNYDQYVELEIREGARLWIEMAEESDAEEPETVARLREAANRGDLFTYLHGCIAENAEITDFPVVSERDYFERSTSTQEAIAAHLEGSSCLIVGSGLTDVPLMNALLSTRRKAREAGHSRYAIVPRIDIGATGASAEAREVISAYSERLTHFDVEGIYVDHFAQIGQFLAEARIASTLSEGEYAESSKRYGQRLSTWWSRWRETNAGSSYLERQRDHHMKLVECVAEISQTLHAKDEHLKLELWLRWDPSLSSRLLRLWASSYALFEDYHMTRTAEIATDSRYACVQAFCEGKPTYDENRQEGERWKTFLGIPLMPQQESNLVVGTIVLASMTAPAASCLGEGRQGSHHGVIDKAQGVGSLLAAAPGR